MRKTAIHSHHHISGHHVSTAATSPEAMLDREIEQLNVYLESLSERCGQPGIDPSALTRELAEQLHRVEDFCRAVEQANHDIDVVRKKQAEFRERTDRFFSGSYLMHRARTWPRGYPGDYEIIDTAYNNQPVSQGLGGLLDRYFLTTTLAQAIQHRRARMQQLLEEELSRRPGARVLNIGCGPCREVLELADVIRRSQAHFTNIDFDSDALLFSARRLREAGLADYVDFRQYNAIRMVNAPKNLSEFGSCDIIYTIGLLDYLSDEILVRLLKALYATLKPNGVLIAVFKDSDSYQTQDYHWLVDWSGFLQRNAQASRTLFDRAGIPSQSLSISRTCDNVMIFYQARQETPVAGVTTLPGPHDRRQEVPATDISRRRRPSQPRPSWHKGGQAR